LNLFQDPLSKLYSKIRVKPNRFSKKLRKNLDKVSVVGRKVKLLEQMFGTDVRKSVQIGGHSPQIGSRFKMAVVTVAQPKFRLSRGARRVRAVLLLVLIITLANQLPHFVGRAFATNHTANPGQVTYVSVHAGDTLWSLAQRYAPNTDPREWIDQVTTMNSLGSAGVLAGERLAIPAN
jgi:LysM domain